MTKPRDPEALLTAYLAVGMDVLPDRVVDSVLDEIHRTRQRAVFGRRTTWSSSRTALGIAAVVAVLVLGGAFLVFVGGRQTVIPPTPTAVATHGASQPAVIGPSTSPTASEQSGPSTSPTPSAITSPAGFWIPTGSMGTPRSGHTAVRLLDGRVLVVGGYPGGEPDLAVTSAELYDPASGTWSPTGSMVRPYQGFGATLLSDGRVLVGDVNDPAADDPELGAEVYDPANGTWAATGKMTAPDDGSATLLRDGRVLVVHGNSSELYDPDRSTWTATGKMTTVSLGGRSAVVMLLDGKVLVAAGSDGTTYAGDSNEVYDPDTGTWTAIANMNVPMFGPAATLLRDGRVLVMSREDGPTSGEVYDPAAGTWTAAGDMARSGSAFGSATMLPDGTVLAAGAPDSLDAELYDPSTGSWIAAAPMLRSHESPAIPLLDGTVLVAGGRDCRDSVCVATSSAELYVPRGVSPPPLPAFPPPPPPVFPSPTPRPSPYPPQAGVVPSGARSWIVKVVNKSPASATLFAAEDGEGGLGLPCGTVTPSVVPPETTMMVTFLLPPKRVKDCWIWLDPVPGEGGSMSQTSDAPMNGEFLITADGQAGWLGR